MKQYPIPFLTTVESLSGIQTNWQSFNEAKSHPIEMSIPPEFDGPGGGYSPEDLFALALQNCFIATFKVFAEKSKLTYHSIKIDSRLEVDRNEKGFPWMAKIHFHVLLTGVQQVENAQRILDKVSKSCMIMNSVNTEKSFEFNIQSELN